MTAGFVPEGRIPEFPAGSRRDHRLPVGLDQLLALIDNTSAVIYMRDLDGRYMVVNREYERLFQLRREEIVGLTDHDLFPAEMADAFRANDLWAASKGGPVQMEEIAPGEDGLVTTGDSHLIRLALDNLLSNAWKFTGKCAQPVIAVGAVQRDGEPVYFVRDNGAGFDMRYAGKLFDPLQRLHTASDFEGNGIGLAIVHRIVSRHGGRIWAESEPGKGATFFFTFTPSRANLEQPS